MENWFEKLFVNEAKPALKRAEKLAGEGVVTVNEPLNIRWDGNTEGLTEVVCAFAPDEFKFYKVSDAVFTDEEIGTMSATFFNSYDIPHDPPFFEESHFSEDSVSSDAFPFVVFIRKAGAIAFESMGGQVFPEVGVYFFKPDGTNFTSSLTSETVTVPRTETVVHTIEPKYLPKALQFGEMPTGGDTLYWDGNTEGLVEVKIPGFGTFYKVSDVALSIGDMQDLVMVDPFGYCWGDKLEILCMTDDILRELNNQLGEEVYYPSGSGDDYPLVILGDAAICVFEDNVKIGVLEFAEKGVYFITDARSVYIQNSAKFPSVKPMDEKYQPVQTGVYLKLGAVTKRSTEATGEILDYSAELREKIIDSVESGGVVRCELDLGPEKAKTIFTAKQYFNGVAYCTGYDVLARTQVQVELYYADSTWKYIPET